jgi:hypothetical protein
MKQILSIILIIFSLGLLTACSVETEINPTPVIVQQYSGSSAFELQYPAEWVDAIIQQGLLVFGPPDVVGFLMTGPSVTVYRISPENAGQGVEAQLEHFLAFGPYEENFEPVTEILETKLGQYSALRIDIAREEFEHLMAMTGYVITTRVNSGAIYHFIATAPTETWVDDWPLLASVIQSVSFNE